MMPLHEEYRPRDWSDVIGQDKAIKRVAALRRRGLSGRAFWLTGASGVGKTTIAKLIASEVADDPFIQEFDANYLTATTLRECERQCWLSATGKGGRAFIVNEAHGLRRDVIRTLLVMLENLPSHVVWIFTTTKDGQDGLFEDQIDAHPLLSRCVTLSLTSQGLCKPAAQRLKSIAEAEGLDGQPVDAYEKLLKRCKNNLRQAIQEIEAGAMLVD
jgi:replication-associated recombination protein RarA